MGTTFSELICAMSEVKGMIKNMKNEWLTFFFILIAGLLTSCSMPNAVESTVSVDNAEEDIILPDDIFEAPEYEYIINNPFNSYVKHFNETTYAATPDGLYAQKDDTKGWELIDVGCIGMGDEFNGDLYYSCDNLVKRYIKLHLNNGMAKIISIFLRNQGVCRRLFWTKMEKYWNWYRLMKLRIIRNITADTDIRFPIQKV